MMLTFYSCIFIFLFILIEITCIKGLTISCQKNRFIDYSQLVEASCLIESCILSLTCIDGKPCECKRDFVVRYNVTIEHEHEDDDEHDDDDSAVHLGVIHQSLIDDNQTILVSF